MRTIYQGCLFDFGMQIGDFWQLRQIRQFRRKIIIFLLLFYFPFGLAAVNGSTAKSASQLPLRQSASQVRGQSSQSTAVSVASVVSAVSAASQAPQKPQALKALEAQEVQHTQVGLIRDLQNPHLPAWYKEEVLMHPHRGCPSNSACSAQVGKQRQHWMDFILSLQQQSPLPPPKIAQQIEKYRQQFGLPVGMWSASSPHPSTQQLIIWDSACPEHSDRSQRPLPLLLAEQFIKSTRKQQINFLPQFKSSLKPLTEPLSEPLLVNGPQVFLDPYYVQEKSTSQSQVLTYYLPRGETPIHMYDGTLWLTREVEGMYYQLGISPQGDWKVSDNIPGRAKSKGHLASLGEVPCPPELLSSFHHFNQHHQVYQSSYCQEIFDSKKRKVYTMLLPWSCPQ